MDVMDMIRRMLLAQESGINTTAEGYPYKRWNRGVLENSSSALATIIYEYEPSSEGRQLRYGGLVAQINTFINGVYKDYWSARDEVDTRNVINANTNGVAVNIDINNLQNAYAYLPDTGQILFAGKDTPYYGHLNINELS